MDKLWNSVRRDSRKFEQSLDKLFRRQTGAYYTSLDLALPMMRELVSHIDFNEKPIYKRTFLEPCVGTGNFVFAYLYVCKELHLSTEHYIELLNNIYVCDINSKALDVYKKNLILIANEWFNVSLSCEYFNSHIGKGLIFDVNSDNICYIPIENVFENSIIKNGFDIVVTNPPYKNLKAEHTHYLSDIQKDIDKQKYQKIKEISKDIFSYSISGTINLYKLFVEEIMEKYLAPTGICALLIPSSILSDKSCAKLRTRILETTNLYSLRKIPENNNYIDASQALCTILMSKGQNTKKILINDSFTGDINQGAYAYIEDIIDESTGNAILVLSENEYRIRNLMRKHPTIKDLSYIKNLRGELDITLNKNSIVKTQTQYQLLRGRHIGYYATTDAFEKEYVKDTFVNSTTKQCYINHSRLVCQQIANVAKKRRIAFALITKDYVLANSCNFISVETNQDSIDEYFLMGILNSDLIDWYFKLTSSNNHINNYEIDNFPIPISYPRKKELSNLVQLYINENNEDLLSKINSLVHEAYGISDKQDTLHKHDDINILSDKYIADNLKQCVLSFASDVMQIIPKATIEECKDIIYNNASIENLYLEKKPNVTKFEIQVLKCLEKKYRKLLDGCILNHTTFKLSDLDLEMITPVPQGGSWKDIPTETIKKSKRLLRINQTGGRTTLYGRIDYSKPSYTITTYFNRPGNGTYVHPIHNRVISVREAARFQTFKDDYYFFGNKTQHLKQVGNAVPTLLAYQIAREIKKKTGCYKSIDLFCGAGGMTAGFKAAGIHSLLSNDIEESACVTLKINNPEINVLCGDITKAETKDAIERAALEGCADIICGGPPCQGFSMAGFRADDDPRNQLFREFVDIVKRVNPKVIVFENVEGLLSYQGGKTYREVHTLFSELGYNTEGRTLMASDYAVPQKRKRVIIICTRNDININPSELFPTPITFGDRQVTARETISDLENVNCGENARYAECDESLILQFFKGKISYDMYINKINNNSTEQEKEIVLLKKDGQLKLNI